MSYNPPLKNIEYIFYIGLISQATGQLQANPTIAAGDFKVSTDGGALGNLGTLPAVTPAGSRAVKITLSTTEMNGDNVVVIGSDAAGAEWDDVIITIQPSVSFNTDGTVKANVAAITAGVDFSATMKTSITTAATAATPTVTISSGTGAGQLSITSGVVKSNMTQIDGSATNGYNATLKLKMLDINNGDLSGVALSLAAANTGGVGAQITGNNQAMYLTAGTGIYLESINGQGITIISDTTDAIGIYGSGNGHGIDVLGAGTGKSINALNDIAVSDGDLTVANVKLISAGQLTVKKNVALPDFAFVMTDTDGVPATGLTVAAERRIDSGVFAACANTPATELANGWYTIDLDASDLNGTSIALRFSAATAADTNFTIITQD